MESSPTITWRAQIQEPLDEACVIRIDITKSKMREKEVCLRLAEQDCLAFPVSVGEIGVLSNEKSQAAVKWVEKQINLICIAERVDKGCSIEEIRAAVDIYFLASLMSIPDAHTAVLQQGSHEFLVLMPNHNSDTSRQQVRSISVKIDVFSDGLVLFHCMPKLLVCKYISPQVYAAGSSTRPCAIFPTFSYAIYIRSRKRNPCDAARRSEFIVKYGVDVNDCEWMVDLVHNVHLVPNSSEENVYEEERLQLPLNALFQWAPTESSRSYFDESTLICFRNLLAASMKMVTLLSQCDSNIRFRKHFSKASNLSHESPSTLFETERVKHRSKQATNSYQIVPQSLPVSNDGFLKQSNNCSQKGDVRASGLSMTRNPGASEVEVQSSVCGMKTSEPLSKEIKRKQSGKKQARQKEHVKLPDGENFVVSSKIISAPLVIGTDTDHDEVQPHLHVKKRLNPIKENSSAKRKSVEQKGAPTKKFRVAKPRKERVGKESQGANEVREVGGNNLTQKTKSLSEKLSKPGIRRPRKTRGTLLSSKANAQPAA